MAHSVKEYKKDGYDPVMMLEAVVVIGDGSNC